MGGVKSNVTKRVSLGGVLAAMTVITLFLAAVMPTNRISLYALSSFFVSIIIIEFGINHGWIFYVVTSLLSTAVIYNKLQLVPYFIFFGIYGIIKFYIERVNNVVLEYLLKFAFFNLSLIVAVFFVREFLLTGLSISLPWWIILVGGQIIFFIYDYVYTLFVQYYKAKLRKILRISG